MSRLSSYLRGEGIVVFFQPLYSFSRRRFVGWEALSRFADAKGALLPPLPVFAEARGMGKSLELDRICRKKALEAFRDRAEESVALCLNIDMSMVDRPSYLENRTYRMCLETGVSSERVVVEIVESEVEDTGLLCDFVDRCRRYGFSVALDDMGSGHSNMDRIPLVQPDLIKVDRRLVDGVAGDVYKQATVGALVGLADRIGALVVAEGVEREEDLHRLLDLGVDIFQGYLVSPPSMEVTPESGDAARRLTALARRVMDRRRERVQLFRQRRARMIAAVRSMVERLSSAPVPVWTETLARLLPEHPDVECVYVLDRMGKMMTPTVFRGSEALGRTGRFFRPAEVGDDLSLKDYFIEAEAGEEIWVSPLYMSKATGRMCRTVSLRFEASAEVFVLCLDVTEADGG